MRASIEGPYTLEKKFPLRIKDAEGNVVIIFASFLGLRSLRDDIDGLLKQEESAAASTATRGEAKPPTDSIAQTGSDRQLIPGTQVMTPQGAGTFWRHTESGLCEVEMDYTYLVCFSEEDVRPLGVGARK